MRRWDVDLLRLLVIGVVSTLLVCVAVVLVAAHLH
jgi:hypothetical protein